MENLITNTVPSAESIWALLRETAQLQKESEQKMEKSREDYDRWKKESDENFDKKLEKSRKDYERWSKENDEKFYKNLEKSREDFERRTKENELQTQKYREDYERRMKKMEETMGSWGNNHGKFAEEYFFNSFENGKQNFFGENFDEIEQNVRGIKKNFKDEYDILLINGKSIGIVEVKFKAHEKDIPKIIRKAETFRVNFPEYKNHKVYLGLATMVFYPELEQECIENGIAIVKQVGDTVVINDEHLKVY